MHILDTDTLTHLYADHPNVVHRLKTVDDTDIATTVITKAELLRGRIDYLLKASHGADLLKAQARLHRTEELLEQMQVLSFDDGSISQFDRFRAQRRFRKIGRSDVLIASITLAHNAILVTRNVRHFSQFPKLAVVNWVD